MTFEEMQLSMKDLHDNQVVQGELLNRVGTNLDRLEEKLERLEGSLERVEMIAELNGQAIAKLVDGAVLLQSTMKGMVQTVEGLSATVDRFIRGMEGNGNRTSGNKPH